MKPQRPLVAQRPLARHCAELLRSGPVLADLLAPFGRACEKAVIQLGPGLAALAGGAAIEASALPPERATIGSLSETDTGIAAHALIALGPQALPALVAIDAALVFRLVDRAFGGKGAAPARLPDLFPLSVDLLAQRIERSVADALAGALGLPGPEAAAIVRRAPRLAALEVFAPETELATCRLEIADGGARPCPITVAAPLETLVGLLGAGLGQPRSAPRPRGPADPAAAPFATMPLPLRAVLVDMALPLSAVSALEVGSVLPVAVARTVPLRIGTTTLAHGSVGTQDDRVALKLTQIA